MDSRALRWPPATCKSGAYDSASICDLVATRLLARLSLTSGLMSQSVCLSGGARLLVCSCAGHQSQIIIIFIFIIIFHKLASVTIRLRLASPRRAATPPRRRGPGLDYKGARASGRAQ